MKMRAKHLVFPGLVLGALAIFCVWFVHREEAKAFATLSFLRYENLPQGSVWPQGGVVAVYLVSNNTAQAFLFEAKHVKASVYGQLAETVMCEGCYFFGPLEAEQGVDPNGRTEVRFLIPHGSTTWQCGVSLLDIKRMRAQIRRPAWQW